MISARKVNRQRKRFCQQFLADLDQQVGLEGINDGAYKILSEKLMEHHADEYINDSGSDSGSDRGSDSGSDSSEEEYEWEWWWVRLRFPSSPAVTTPTRQRESSVTGNWELNLLTDWEENRDMDATTTRIFTTNDEYTDTYRTSYGFIVDCEYRNRESYWRSTIWDEDLKLRASCSSVPSKFHPQALYKRHGMVTMMWCGELNHREAMYVLQNAWKSVDYFIDATIADAPASREITEHFRRRVNGGSIYFPPRSLTEAINHLNKKNNAILKAFNGFKVDTNTSVIICVGGDHIEMLSDQVTKGWAGTSWERQHATAALETRLYPWYITERVYRIRCGEEIPVLPLNAIGGWSSMWHLIMGESAHGSRRRVGRPRPAHSRMNTWEFEHECADLHQGGGALFWSNFNAPHTALASQVSDSLSDSEIKRLNKHRLWDETHGRDYWGRRRSQYIDRREQFALTMSAAYERIYRVAELDHYYAHEARR